MDNKGLDVPPALQPDAIILRALQVSCQAVQLCNASIVGVFHVLRELADGKLDVSPVVAQVECNATSSSEQLRTALVQLLTLLHLTVNIGSRCWVASLKLQHLQQVGDVLGPWADEDSIVMDLPCALQVRELLSLNQRVDLALHANPLVELFLQLFQGSLRSGGKEVIHVNFHEDALAGIVEQPGCSWVAAEPQVLEVPCCPFNEALSSNPPPIPFLLQLPNHLLRQGHTGLDLLLDPSFGGSMYASSLMGTCQKAFSASAVMKA